MMKLSIAETFLLIAQHPIKGRFLTSDIHINYGIIGAFLLEMSLEGKVEIENGKLIIKHSESTDHKIISELSITIANSKKPRKIRYWISKLARNSKKYKWIILSELADNNFIRIENKTFLGLIPYKRNYLIDNVSRDHLIQELKSKLLLRQELSNENLIIFGLIEACKMHKIITSDKNELKIIRKVLKQIIKESPIAETVDETIKQVQAAIIGAIVASTVVSSSAS